MMKLLTQVKEQGVKYAATTDLIKVILGDKPFHRISHIPLNRLRVLSCAELQAEGLTERQAVILKAAIELSNRREDTRQTTITSSRALYDALKWMHDLDHEQFHVAYLSKRNNVIKLHHVSTGGIDGTVADIQLIVKEAILCNAKAMILIHNHPSGIMTPSETDKKLTQQVKNAAALFNIATLDHLIIAGTQHGTPEGYYSFADEGIL